MTTTEAFHRSRYGDQHHALAAWAHKCVVAADLARMRNNPRAFMGPRTRQCAVLDIALADLDDAVHNGFDTRFAADNVRLHANLLAQLLIGAR